MAASPISLKSLVPGTQRGDPAFGSVGLFLGLRDLPRRKGGVFIRARVRHPDHAPGVDSELGATEVLPISEPNLDFTLPIPLHLAGPPGSVDLRLVVFEVFACREGALPLPGATPAPAAVAALDTEALGEHVDRVLSAPADRGTPADGTALLDATAGGAGVFAPVFERLRARGGAPPADGGLAPFIIITATPLTPQARALGALQLRLSFRGLPVRPSTSRPSAPFLMVHRHVGASEAALGDADFEVAGFKAAAGRRKARPQCAAAARHAAVYVGRGDRDCAPGVAAVAWRARRGFGGGAARRAGQRRSVREA